MSDAMPGVTSSAHVQSKAGIAVAISGGGHRASAWGFGALGALVETGLNGHIVSVASVSGGSITNGAIANATTDLSQYESTAAYADAIGPALRMVAIDGLFPSSRATSRWVAVTLSIAFTSLLMITAVIAALVAFGRDDPLVAYAIGGSAAGVLLAFLARNVRALRPPGAVGPRVLILPLLVGVPLLSWAGAASVQVFDGWWSIVAIAAWVAVVGLLAVVAVRRLAGRGRVVADALASGVLAGDDGRPRILGDIRSTVNHVICSTDLESANHFYLAPRFLSGYREGITLTGPNGVTLATAVQSSAALPVAFPPTRVRTGPFARAASITVPAVPPEQVVLADGGVYDNMGDQWERGLADRCRLQPELCAIQPLARFLIVANASANWGWQAFPTTNVIGTEVTALQRDQGVQYNVSTARRRYDLIQAFQLTAARMRAAAEHGGDPDDVVGLVGAIAMIDRSPLRLVRSFIGDDPADPVTERATSTEAFLLAIRSEREWDALYESNAKVPTTLDRITVPVTLSLMEHSYYLVLASMYVIHDKGSLRRFPRAEYERVLTD